MRLITKTFEVDDITHDEHLAEINEWLDEVTKEMDDGDIREEWIVCDFEDIPMQYQGEYSIDPEWFKFTEEVASMDQNNAHEILMAWIDHGMTLDGSACNDAYHGEWKNDEEFIQDMIMETTEEFEKQFPCITIDWECTARTYMQDFFEHDGHYFSSH